MEIPIQPDFSTSNSPSSSIQRLPPHSIPSSHFPPRRTTNLISTELGARILQCSDEFFAPASSLLLSTAPIHKPGVYISTGKWYDGWETRRHNRADFDWVVIELGVHAGVIKAVEIDTAFFDGNHAPVVAVEAGDFEGLGESVVRRRARERDGDGGLAACPTATATDGEEETATERHWTTILPKQECGPSQRHAWLLPTSTSTNTTTTKYTHIRLLMYPDGGIARFRLYGVIRPPPTILLAANDTQQHHQPVEPVDLAGALNGGLIEATSDAHFGPATNLLLPGRGQDMRDGWETRRSRGGSHTDWVIVKLATPGYVERVVIDTKDFKGNFPRAVRVLGIYVLEDEERMMLDGRYPWTDLLGVDAGDEEGAVRECGPDREHVFHIRHHDDDDRDEDGNKKVKGMICSHVKLVIIPDGGVKRFRVFGRPGVLRGYALASSCK